MIKEDEGLFDEAVLHELEQLEQEGNFSIQACVAVFDQEGTKWLEVLRQAIGDTDEVHARRACP